MKPHDYVGSIIGHESEGSILYLLKKLGWATSISAGLTESHGYDYGTFGCIFTIEIKLTYDGFSRYDQVVAVVFQYLNMMRSTTLPAWFYEEAKTIADLDFQFQEDESAIEKCEDLAVLMQKMYRVPPEDLLSYETYKESFDATLVEETVLSHLNVSNLKIHLVSKAFSAEASTFIEEPWFGVRYAFESISKEKWSAWIPRLVRQIGLSDKHIIWEDSEHQEEVNTLVEYYFQMSNHTIITLPVADLIQQIMEEPLFDVLRTKKQLGYEVSCSVRVTHGILGYSIKVVSSSAPTSTVSQAIDEFLNEFKQTLENMSSERLNEYIQAQIQIKNEPDINMTAASMRYWGEIITERFAFELNKDIAKWLQSANTSVL
ncbi:unnamed protein product [Aphanomyces euteiches]